VLIWLLEVNNTSIIFLVEAFKKVAKRVGLGEGTAFIEILIKGHSLHEISHPFLTQVLAGEFEVDGILIDHPQPDEIVLLLSIATQLPNVVDADAIIDFLIFVVSVEFQLGDI
jgi:hypothetical protein